MASPLCTRTSSYRTQRASACAELPLRVQNLLSCVQAPFLLRDLLHLSGMSRKKSHVGHNSKESKIKGGTKSATQIVARDRRANLEPVAHLEPTRTVAPPEPDQALADMAFIDECAPASAPRAEARACLEGTAWRRRRRFMLGKKDKSARWTSDKPKFHNSAKFGAMIASRM
ncbi:hypothetical protein T492DRAFT_1144848 [Pavlovales sp. CCMP2436]|nr:hypothetical protein T492DRAFT_1144848 [Pavlovales sp. CCMP2436]